MLQGCHAVAGTADCVGASKDGSARYDQGSGVIGGQGCCHAAASQGRYHAVTVQGRDHAAARQGRYHAAARQGRHHAAARQSCDDAPARQGPCVVAGQGSFCIARALAGFAPYRVPSCRYRCGKQFCTGGHTSPADRGAAAVDCCPSQ